MWQLDNELKVIGEIMIGPKENPGTHLRLVETPKGKRYIKIWSSLSKEWKTMYRYDVEKAWESWKRLAERISK